MKSRSNPTSVLFSLIALTTLIVSGCGEQSPPYSAVRGALDEYYDKNLVRFLADAGLRTGGASASSAFGQGVKSFTMRNKYVRDVAGERIHVCDLEVELTYGKAESTTERLSLGLARRGNAWKWVLVEQPERVVSEKERREQEAVRQVRESEARTLDAAFREQFK
jgi:hypothetical protein